MVYPYNYRTLPIPPKRLGHPVPKRNHKPKGIRSFEPSPILSSSKIHSQTRNPFELPTKLRKCAFSLCFCHWKFVPRVCHHLRCQSFGLSNARIMYLVLDTVREAVQQLPQVRLYGTAKVSRTRTLRNGRPSCIQGHPSCWASREKRTQVHSQQISQPIHVDGPARGF